MNLSTWTIRTPIPAIVIFLLATLAGFYSLKMLPIQDFPDMDVPVVSVTASLAGASPSQLETEVTRHIEDAIATVGDVKHITSNVTEGTSVTAVEFVFEKNVNEALDDVRDAVNRIRADLPAEMIDPTVAKIKIVGGLPLQTFAVTSERMDEEAVSWYIDNTVMRSVLQVKGVGQVSRIGGVTREVRIELDPAKLRSLNVTAADVSRQLRASQQELSGGAAQVGDMRQSFRILATVEQAKDLENFDITLGGGRHVKLGQIATVSDTTTDRSRLALLDGKHVVGFQINRAQGGASAVDIASDVTRRMDRLNHENPAFQIKLVNTTIDNIVEQYEGSMHMLYEGALLAVLVVWFFLRDWRATVISASALPLSVIPTFAVIYLFGYSLNVITLLALTLVVGLLVDDAIVEIENIVRHLRKGKTVKEAAIEAVNEIGLAVVATTMTLVAVFLPTAFMGGVPGLIFKQFGWTATFAVLASLAVARLLTPMMAAYFLKPHEEKERQDGRLMRWYMDLVALALRRRGLTLLATLAFFLGSLALIPFMPSGFIPAGDHGRTQVSAELMPGSSIGDTEQVMRFVADKIQAVEGVRDVFSYVSASSAGDARDAIFSIDLLPRDERDVSQAEIENTLRGILREIPGVRFGVGGEGNGEKYQLILSGSDSKLLEETARKVTGEIRGVQGIGNIISSASLLRPEIMVRPDFSRAAELGVTAESINQTLRVASAGDYEVSLARLNLPDRQVYIRVQLPESARMDLDSIRQLRVSGKEAPVPLSAVADVTLGSGPAEIARYDRSRNVTLDIELGGRSLGDVMKEVAQLPAMKQLPPGITQRAAGDSEFMEELFGSFGVAMLAGILCVYMVLVLLFHDFLLPVTILTALPLSVGGAFTLLMLTGNSFSLPSLIGLLMLMGIVTKNSILLVDYGIIAMREGMNQTDALLDACHKRARPIIMTTLAMGAGMVPVALGFGVDPSFRSPMAIAVIGGLITSTALSLVVVPVMFTYITQFEAWVVRRFKSNGSTSVR